MLSQIYSKKEVKKMAGLFAMISNNIWESQESFKVSGLVGGG